MMASTLQAALGGSDGGQHLCGGRARLCGGHGWGFNCKEREDQVR